MIDCQIVHQGGGGGGEEKDTLITQTKNHQSKVKVKAKCVPPLVLSWFMDLFTTTPHTLFEGIITQGTGKWAENTKFKADRSPRSEAITILSTMSCCSQNWGMNLI